MFFTWESASSKLRLFSLAKAIIFSIPFSPTFLLGTLTILCKFNSSCGLTIIDRYAIISLISALE